MLDRSPALAEPLIHNVIPRCAGYSQNFTRGTLLCIGIIIGVAVVLRSITSAPFPTERVGYLRLSASEWSFTPYLLDGVVPARVFYTLIELEPHLQSVQLSGRVDAQVRQQQLLTSLRSLRSHDKEIPVHIITYGEPLPEEFLSDLGSLDVEIVAAGSYRDALDKIMPGSGPFLEAYPVLSKFLALPFMADRPARQLLYVDNDTIFLGAPATLFNACKDADFYTREEAQSERSHEKTNILHVDEGICKIVANILKIQKPCLPMNTGVILYNNNAWVRLSAQLKVMLRLLLSFCMFLAQNYPVAEFPDKQLQYCRDHKEDLAKLIDNAPLHYPSLNLWTREQYAALFTFSLAGLVQCDFQIDQVLQGCEELQLRKPPRPIISHYWSPSTEKFCRMVVPRFYPEIDAEPLSKAIEAQAKMRSQMTPAQYR